MVAGGDDQRLRARRPERGEQPSDLPIDGRDFVVVAIDDGPAGLTRLRRARGDRGDPEEETRLDDDPFNCFSQAPLRRRLATPGARSRRPFDARDAIAGASSQIQANWWSSGKAARMRLSDASCSTVAVGHARGTACVVARTVTGRIARSGWWHVTAASAAPPHVRSNVGGLCRRVRFGPRARIGRKRRADRRGAYHRDGGDCGPPFGVGAADARRSHG